MYALKLMTEREGHKVEESHYLGNMYRLEFFPVVDNPDIAARLEYSTKKVFLHSISSELTMPTLLR